MNTTEDREQFADRGLLRLPGAVAAGDAALMRERLWQHLRQTCGAVPGRPDTWPAAPPAHFQALTRTGAFDALGTPRVFTAIEALVGPEGWQVPEHWGRPLVTFPTDGPWRLPVRGWHQDSADRPADPILVAFACLAPVRATGGGTLVVLGSHRLTAAGGPCAGLRSAQVRARLIAEHSWFRDLLTPGAEPERTTQLLSRGCVTDGVRLELAELTGEAGDVFLMHPRLLHAVAPNTLDAPRLMLLHFVDRQGR